MSNKVGEQRSFEIDFIFTVQMILCSSIFICLNLPEVSETFVISGKIK